MANAEKTNVMRILDAKKAKYVEHHVDIADAVSGVEMASLMGVDVNIVYKTLVCVAKSLNHYVFVIPAASELNLKKAAAAVNEKSMEMLKSKDLLPLTGYIHGGCSPIGMKKFFKTTIDISAKDRQVIIFSAGKIGYQVEISPIELAKVIRFAFANVVD